MEAVKHYSVCSYPIQSIFSTYKLGMLQAIWKNEYGDWLININIHSLVIWGVTQG